MDIELRDEPTTHYLLAMSATKFQSEHEELFRGRFQLRQHMQAPVLLQHLPLVLFLAQYF
jgi:hypothetical protein